MREGERLAARLRGRIADERVLAAIATVPRERFVAAAERDRAYENVALPIARGQSISQPLVVARMLEVLATTPTDLGLDVGTGSGYHAALLSRLVAHVWTIERIPELSARAAATLAELGIENVSFAIGDGAEGLPARAPFDVINVAAAGAEIPAALEAQLAPGGRLVIPIGGENQQLIQVIRTQTGLRRDRLEPVRFVPLLPGTQDPDMR